MARGENSYYNGPHQFGDAAKGSSIECANFDLTHFPIIAFDRNGRTIWNYIDRLRKETPLQRLLKYTPGWFVNFLKTNFYECFFVILIVKFTTKVKDKRPDKG